MSLLRSPILTDTWTPVTWDEFVQLIEQPEHQHHKAYYHNGLMRLETLPTGSDHARDHAILMLLIGLFGYDSYISPLSQGGLGGILSIHRFCRSPSIPLGKGEARGRC